MDPFSRLSLDQLAQVLSHVDIRHRLSSCSLVSSTWRAAAARATTSITVEHSTPSFGQWLLVHTAQVQVSSLRVLSLRFGLGANVLQLPVAQLQRLEDLQLQGVEWSPGTASAGAAVQSLQAVASSSSSSSSLQPLTALTALTRLALTGRSVRLAGLSALTGLQELLCAGLYNSPDSWRCISAPAVAKGDLVAAFPRLQLLTSLILRGEDMASAAVVSHISALQSLQQLVLENSRCCSIFEADSLAALPQSLTQLNLSLRPAGSLSASNAAGLSQLAALHLLNLCNVQRVDLALLAGMRSLRSLRLFDCTLAAQGSLQQVVSLLSNCTALTSLYVAATGGHQQLLATPAPLITAAEAGALTSCSQLAELALCDARVQLQPQAYASLFPPGRQLQHLTERASQPCQPGAACVSCSWTILGSSCLLLCGRRCAHSASLPDCTCVCPKQLLVMMCCT